MYMYFIICPLVTESKYMYVLVVYALLHHSNCIIYIYIYIVGSGWVSRIGSAISGCKGLVAVITNNYVNSDSCTKELHMAHSSGKKIFPVIRETVDYTQSEKALGVKFIIQGINWVYFRPDVANYKYSQSLAHLVDGLIASGKQCIASSEVH